MDKVRFGRALGYGARAAAKSLADAVDAATSPDPNHQRKAQVTQHIANVAQGVRQVHAAKSQVTTHAKRSFLAPIKSFTSVIWLQVTGTFFALFAVTMGGAVIKHRDYFSLPLETDNGHKIYFYLLAFLVFGYFTVSNFVRANRRQRR